MIDYGKRNLLGVAISAVDYEYAVAKIIDAAQNGRRCATTALAVHGVVIVQAAVSTLEHLAVRAQGWRRNSAPLSITRAF